MNKTSLESFMNYCDTMKITEESKISNEDTTSSIKFINKANPDGCGYPCTNLTFHDVNISVREFSSDNEKTMNNKEG